MSYQQELDALRARGYAVGTADVRTGLVRVWIPGGDDAVDVRLGRELEELAEGKLTFGEIRERREGEVVNEEP